MSNAFAVVRSALPGNVRSLDPIVKWGCEVMMVSVHASKLTRVATLATPLSVLALLPLKAAIMAAEDRSFPLA